MARLFLLTLLAMLAFAGNSILCRLALKQTKIDAATFTAARLIAGAAVLFLITEIRRRRAIAPAARRTYVWLAAIALFVYALAFSYAYLQLSAGTGALLLFGAVQITMIFWGLIRGEHLSIWQIFGLVAALSGLVWLVFPGLAAPPLFGSVLMATAGIAWGVYSLLGRTAGDPIARTSSNFLHTIPFCLILCLVAYPIANFDSLGLFYALVSGAITSGLGYVIWYSALPRLSSVVAGAAQLGVPVLAAAGGILFLGEALTLRYLLASITILGGIVLVVVVTCRQQGGD